MQGRAPLWVAIHCPTCSADARMGRADDPLRGSLRRWTEAERRRLVDDAHADVPVTCPWTARLSGRVLAAGCGVSLPCMRCGNEHQGS